MTIVDTHHAIVSGGVRRVLRRCLSCGCRVGLDHVSGSVECSEDRRERDRARRQ